MPSRSASMRAGRKPAPSSAWRSVDASALGPACEGGPNPRRPTRPNGALRITSTRPLGRTVRLTSSNRRARSAGSPRRSAFPSTMPTSKVPFSRGHVGPSATTTSISTPSAAAAVLQRPGGLRAVHDGTGPARKTRLPGELRKQPGNSHPHLHHPLTQAHPGHVHGQLHGTSRPTETEQACHWTCLCLPLEARSQKGQLTFVRSQETGV